VKPLQLRDHLLPGGDASGVHADWSLRCMACLDVDGTTGRCVLRKMQRGRLLCNSKGAYQQEGEWEATKAIHTYLQVRA
jgi:hypothetical protein